MRKRSDAGGGEASVAQQDPRHVVLSCDACGTKMSLANLQKMEGKCWNCEHVVDVEKSGSRVKPSAALPTTTPTTTPTIPSTATPATPTPGGNPWKPPHPLEYVNPVDAIVAAAKDKRATDAAIAAARGDDTTKPEPDPAGLRPESVDASKVAVPALSGVAPGFTARPVSISELVGRLNAVGYRVSVVEAAKWTEAQNHHALMVASATEKDLAPQVEAWLMATYEKPKPTGRRGVKTESVSSAASPVQAEVRAKAVSGEALSEGIVLSTETVSVTWGEEKFTPVAYSTVTVGPFAALTTLAPGEDRQKAAARLMSELAEFAAVERDRKFKEFLKAYRALKASVKEDA